MNAPTLSTINPFVGKFSQPINSKTLKPKTEPEPRSSLKKATVIIIHPYPIALPKASRTLSYGSVSYTHLRAHET